MNPQDNKKTLPEKQKLSNKQLVIEGVLVLFIFLNIYAFLSLITFDPADPGWSQTAWHEPIKNIGGAGGAYLGDVLLQSFGLSAYIIPLLGIFICAKLAYYFYGKIKRPNYFTIAITLIGVVALIFSLCGILEININDWQQYQSGGVIGALTAITMVPIFHSAGTTLILLALLIISITLLTRISWLTVIECIGQLIVWLAMPIMGLISIIRNKHRPRQQENDNMDEDDDDMDEDEELPQEIPQQRTSFGIIPTFLSKNRKNKQPALAEEATTLLQTAQQNGRSFLDVDDYRVVEESPYSINTDFPPSYTHKMTESAAEIQPPFMLDDFFKSEISAPEFNENTPFHHDDELTPPAVFVSDNEGYDHIYYHDEKEPLPDILPVFEDQTEPVEIGSFTSINIDEDEDYYPISFSVKTSDNESYKESDKENYKNSDNESEQDTTISPMPIMQPIKDEVPQVQVSLQPLSTIEQLKQKAKESVIHPLLARNEQPLVKPNTPLPSLALLSEPPKTQEPINVALLKATAGLVEKSLNDYRVNAKVVDILPGPVITLYELDLAPGVKASRISTLSRDLARSLSTTSVRVVEVIPGKPYVGLEVPNIKRQTVYFREVLDSPQFRDAKSPLSIVLGKDISGQSVVADLAKMPHLLVAGTTGSGKSVGVNAMILSILYKAKPEDVRFIMIDPKMLELSVYEGIPHLLTQVVTDMKDAANALNWCVNEMERRYRLMSSLGVRNVVGYNEKIKLADDMGHPIPDPLWKPGDTMDENHPMLEKLPYIVVMVDEFADLIMAVGKKIEELIARLAQKARAAGIHLVLATQRPSVDVITGLIKANIPTRIAFTVSSKIDSRTILDQMGAESLLGMGDMLYLPPNSSIPLRVHGAFVRDEEVHAVANDWKARGTPKYIESITASTEEGDSGDSSEEQELDPLFDQAVAFVIEKQRASISGIQRQFRIGYNRAARIVEQMEIQGIVSAQNHSGNREVLANSSYNDY